MNTKHVYNTVVWLGIFLSSWGVGAVQGVHGQIVCTFIALLLLGSQGIYWLHDRLIERETPVCNNYTFVNTNEPE